MLGQGSRPGLGVGFGSCIEPVTPQLSHTPPPAASAHKKPEPRANSRCGDSRITPTHKPLIAANRPSKRRHALQAPQPEVRVAPQAAALATVVCRGLEARERLLPATPAATRIAPRAGVACPHDLGAALIQNPASVGVAGVQRWRSVEHSAHINVLTAASARALPAHSQPPHLVHVSQLNLTMPGKPNTGWQWPNSHACVTVSLSPFHAGAGPGHATQQQKQPSVRGGAEARPEQVSAGLQQPWPASAERTHEG